MVPDRQWKVVSDQALHFRCWNKELVVYNSLSGDTHLLDETAAHILLELQKAPADVVMLATSAAFSLQVEMSDEWISQTEQILADLDKLSLIEQSLT